VNVGQIRTRVQNKIGDTSGAEVTSLAILDWINDGMTEIARRTSQPQAIASISTVIGTEAYNVSAFAADVLRLRSVKYDGVPLESLSMEDADTLYVSATQTGTGTPRWFWIHADQITVWPKPDAAKTLQLFYVKRPAAVDDDADIPGIPLHYHGDLVDYVTVQALETVGESGAADRKMAAFEQRSRESASDLSTPTDLYGHVSASLDDMGW
jgi:hypothetical protein